MIHACSDLDRRTFLRLTGRALGAVGAALLAACDPSSGRGSARLRTFFTARFEGRSSLDDEWIVVRYGSNWRRAQGHAEIDIAAAPHRGTDESRPQSEYLGEPMVVRDKEAADVELAAEMSLEGLVEGGLIARWCYDRAYAILVSRGEVLLCRYSTSDRRVLARGEIDARPGRCLMALRVRGNRISGSVEAKGEKRSLEARDPQPLEAGMVGVVVNPRDPDAAARVSLASFKAGAFERPGRSRPRFAYRFTGAIVPEGGGYRAHVTARTVIPSALSFEIGTDRELSDAQRFGPKASAGRLGAVHTWMEGLARDTTYYWRAIASDLEDDVSSEVAAFRTPPPPGAPVRFAFASCTSGRLPRYISFDTAASFEPAFYLHAGDWGYADLNSMAHRGDHFQARWTRLLRHPDLNSLLASTPLLFWQDDHDYQADNGWAKTCRPYAIEAFDELHANPTNEYFDVRWGDLHIWCLDCRLYATDPEAPDGERKSRLGAKQKEWLKSGMMASDAPVRIVATPMVFRNKVKDDPGWHNVYTTEREELLSFFSSVPATVVILSGDSHGLRLIHHFEFGNLYEITASGTDFDRGASGQGDNDPEHTLIDVEDKTGFAIVDLDAASPNRSLGIRCIATEDGSTLFEKKLNVRTPG